MNKLERKHERTAAMLDNIYDAEQRSTSIGSAWNFRNEMNISRMSPEHDRNVLPESVRCAIKYQDNMSY